MSPIRALIRRAGDLRELPLLNPVLLRESWLERAGYPEDASHRPHLDEAIAWLTRAQDATGTGGIARGYSLTWTRYFGSRGWQPAYPETTGYIIPTLFEAAGHTGRPDLAERAMRAARWESDIQLPEGGVQGGVVGQPVSPAIFNTGQVVFGWLAARLQGNDARSAESARRAGRYLAANVDATGRWLRPNSAYADAVSSLYNARTAWALAEAGQALDEPSFVDAAARNLRWVRGQQHANGWLPRCCLSDPARPLVHTLAYAIRGLLEGGRALADATLLAGATRAAEALAAAVRSDGWLAGRFDDQWRPAADYVCLTGSAQMANNWMRLYDVTGEQRWLEPVPRVIGFLKRTQNRAIAEPGLRGGIRGSYPIGGGYGAHQVLSWATKYFADALIRSERLAASRPAGPAAHLA